MSNPMHMSTEELVIQVLSKHTNEKQVLDQWVCIINQELPRPKRLTKRCLCQLFKAFPHDAQLKMIKEYYNIKCVFYTFVPEQVIETHQLHPILIGQNVQRNVQQKLHNNVSNNVQQSLFN